MITPFPPPLGPRIHLLRKRRFMLPTPVKRHDAAPRPDPGDTAATTAARDRHELSDEALRWLARDLLDANATTNDQNA